MTKTDLDRLTELTVKVGVLTDIACKTIVEIKEANTQIQDMFLDLLQRPTDRQVALEQAFGNCQRPQLLSDICGPSGVPFGST